MFVVYVYRPFLVTTIQHAAVSVVFTLAEMGAIVRHPTRSRTRRRSRRSAAECLGDDQQAAPVEAEAERVWPAEGCAFGPLA